MYLKYLSKYFLSEIKVNSGLNISRNDGKHMFANTFCKMHCSSYCCNDRKYSYFTRNIKFAIDMLTTYKAVMVLINLKADPKQK